MNNFRKLNVWKKAVDLTTEIYRLTRCYPVEEQYGLMSQMRRCAISISSNIAEGAGRGSVKDFSHFINIAMGSCYELETQILISRNLKYLKDSDFESVSQAVVEIQKMLHSLRRSLAVNPLK